MRTLACRCMPDGAVLCYDLKPGVTLPPVTVFIVLSSILGRLRALHRHRGQPPGWIAGMTEPLNGAR
ncbi:MAG: hypothetical protein KA148_14120, partial [Ottowia sp.]|nr:hypothetical protein [Ottowia sp.]